MHTNNVIFISSRFKCTKNVLKITELTQFSYLTNLTSAISICYLLISSVSYLYVINLV